MQRATVLKADFNQETISVAVFLRRVQAHLQEHAAARGTELAVERAPADLAVVGNEDALHQILLNLVDTATRCVMAGSSIRLWCESNAQQVAVRMRCGACHGTGKGDSAVISATREVARSMGGDVKVGPDTYTVELLRSA